MRLKEQSSIRRCQSAELRASLETSKPMTMPALPRATSLTRCWKPSRRRGTRTGFAEIVVDYMDPLGRPAGADGPVTQSILTLGALDVLRDLAQGRLSDIEISVAAQVLGGDLKISHVPQPLLLSK